MSYLPQELQINEGSKLCSCVLRSRRLDCLIIYLRSAMKGRGLLLLLSENVQGDLIKRSGTALLKSEKHTCMGSHDAMNAY